MRIVVSGSSGFVGSALIESLKLRKDIVINTLQFKHITLATEYGFSDEFEKNTDISGADVLIHLAGLAHQKHSVEELLKVNYEATMKLADLAANLGVKRFVYVSSIKVNGEYTNERPFDELSVPNPMDAYGESKWKAENALRHLAQTNAMEVVIVRPPLVYGPKVKANFLSLLKLVYKKSPLPLAIIQNKRSLIYVENLVGAIMLCATHPKAAGNTYLVSDGEDVSTPELIKKIGVVMNRPARLFAFPVRWMRFLASLVGKQSAVDRLSQSLVVDSLKIRNELGWNPPFSMDEGLKATADWYLSQRK